MILTCNDSYSSFFPSSNSSYILVVWRPVNRLIRSEILSTKWFAPSSIQVFLLVRISERSVLPPELKKRNLRIDIDLNLLIFTYHPCIINLIFFLPTTAGCIFGSDISIISLASTLDTKSWNITILWGCRLTTSI